MTIIAIPNILREKFGDEATAALVSILTKVEESAKEVTLQVAESRFEQKLAEFETKIEKRLSEFKTDLIKWMIGISISQMVIILAIISAFFRK